MKHFIIASFLLMGWTFYQLSDGADFRPPQAVIMAKAARAIQTAPAPAPRQQSVKATTLVASPAVVARARPDTSPVPAFLQVKSDPPVDPATAALTAEADINTAVRLGQIRTGFGRGLDLFSDENPIDQPLMLASLEQGAAGLIAAPLPESTSDTQPGPATWTPPPADIRADIREITGTRVNMRDGPGTIYPVISRLTIGHEVEVLGESGTGWLRLRILPENLTGWISASLISKAAP